MVLRIVSLFIIMGSLASCGFTRNRAGYYPMEEKDVNQCNVKVATMVNMDGLVYTQVGKLRLGEAPFLEYSWMCDKQDALRVIQQEACNANANFANIVTENYPTFMQSCYHCEVIFYKLPDSQQNLLDGAIAKTLKNVPPPDPEYGWVFLGKMVKTIAIFGAAIGISTILRLTQQGT